MRKSLRYCSVLALAGAMILGQSICSYAAPSYGPGQENTAESPQEASAEGEPETTAGGEAHNADAAAELQQESEAAAQEAAQHQLGPMDVPMRMPHLQTTVLHINEDFTGWGNPFVNDQWIEHEDRSFASISIFLTDIIGNIHYRAYTTSNGWTPWAMNGQQTVLPADQAPIEAIQVRFSGPVHNDYDIYYTTKLSDGTETDWAKNSASAGTMGQGKHLTGFRMAFFRNTEQADIPMDKPVDSVHADGIQDVDGHLRYISGDGSNFMGWGWKDTDRYYFNDSIPVTGWQYIDGYKYFFAEDGKLVQDLEPIIGAGGPYHIKINKEMNTMTIYVNDGANGYIIPLKTFLLSTGDDTPLGTFKTPEKYRWRLMNSGVYAQYATRLGSGLPYLMHSIIYDRPDTYTVWASTYNHLGVARSAGCIRLLSSDAKWIFDHCPTGTTITVYNDPIPGPYERPVIPYEIPFEQNWDPSDPNITEAGIAAASAGIIARSGQ